MTDKQKSSNNQLKLIKISICFMVVGFGLLWWCKVFFTNEEDIMKWPSTMGIIDEIDTYKYFKGRSSTEIYGISGTYHYVVNNASFTSSKLSLTGNYESTLFEEINRLKDKYKVGAKALVFYNPKNSFESVLIREGSIFTNGPFPEMLVAGIVCVLQGVLIIAAYIYNKIIKR